MHQVLAAVSAAEPRALVIDRAGDVLRVYRRGCGVIDPGEENDTPWP
jgi:hypothetical protein